MHCLYVVYGDKQNRIKKAGQLFCKNFKQKF